MTIWSILDGQSGCLLVLIGLLYLKNVYGWQPTPTHIFSSFRRVDHLSKRFRRFNQLRRTSYLGNEQTYPNDVFVWPTGDSALTESQRQQRERTYTIVPLPNESLEDIRRRMLDFRRCQSIGNVSSWTHFVCLPFADFTSVTSEGSAQTVLNSLPIEKREEAIKDSGGRLPRPQESVLSYAASGADFVELRADLWDQEIFEDITKGVQDGDILAEERAAKRVHTIFGQVHKTLQGTSIGTLFTLRRKSEFGQLPDEHADLIVPWMVKEAIRAGISAVDVEAKLNMSTRQTTLDLLSLPPESSKPGVIISWHTGSTPKNVSEACSWIEQTISAVDSHTNINLLAVKVVTAATPVEEGAETASILSSAAKNITGVLYNRFANSTPAVISIAMGKNCELSRILNKQLTPTTHAILGKPVAPGQLSIASLNQRRQDLHLLRKCNYAVVGSPVNSSRSPLLHNTAYHATGLPHVYSISEQLTWKSAEDLLRSGTLDGLSVTIPLKEAVLKSSYFEGRLEKHALAIGAVNTVKMIHNSNGERIPQGLNTDWLGIQRPVNQLLKRRWGGKLPFDAVALVLGAGGTARAACYAAQSLGLKLVVANRNPEKAKSLAAMYGGEGFSFDELSIHLKDMPIVAIISTLPASSHSTWHPSLQSPDLFHNQPVVMDVVYLPSLTPLLSQAKKSGCLIIQGASMLLEQAAEQFTIWNGRSAPRAEMATSLFSDVDKIDDVNPLTL